MKTLFTLMFLIFLCSFANANIIYVDDSNTSGIENGSLQYPYNTVTEGVNAAVNGDTVFIFSGTYFAEETFPILLKAGITLIGENRELTVIQDSLELSVISEPEPVFIHNLTFDRIKISRRTPATIPQFANFIKNSTIMNDVEFRYYGIHLFKLQDCKINGQILFAAGTDSLNRIRSEYNTVEDSEIDSSLACIFSGNHKFIIMNNEIGSDALFTCSIDSILTDPDILITDNLIGGSLVILGLRVASVVSGNIVNEGIGLTIAGYGKSQNILNNEITSSSASSDGIYLKLASSPAVIENNEITLTEKSAGIYIKSSDTVTVKGNVITGGNSGLSLVGSKISILGNIITQADTGMMLLSSQLLCNENSISNCSGIGILSEGLGSFNYNNITNCGTGIIELGGDFFYNTISGCSGDGIISTVTGSFGHNKITNNQGAGIRIQKFADLGGGFYNSPGNNILQSNGTYDVLVESTQDSIIYAKNNLWDHFTETEISQNDIYDYNDDTTLALVIFTPFLLTDVDEKSDGGIPTDFILHQNYPNPFNPSTKISWQSPVGSWQSIKLFDVLGKEIETIVDGYYDAGIHSTLYIVHSKLPSGVYFYQLRAGNFIQTKKMILAK